MESTEPSSVDEFIGGGGNPGGGGGGGGGAAGMCCDASFMCGKSVGGMYGF